MADTSRRWVPLTHVTLGLRCPDCDQRGDVAVQHVLLFRCVSRPDRNFYTWTCPVCGQPVTQRADTSYVCLLVGGGVRVRMYEWPLEVDEPMRAARPWGPYDAADLSLDIAALPEIEEAS